MNSKIKYAAQAGRNMQVRDDYMDKARASLLLEDRKFYAGLARSRNQVVVAYLRAARVYRP